MNRILVVRGGAIGDFVLTLPAIKVLREAFPKAHLEILGYKQIIALAEQRFYANAVRSIEFAGLAGFFARGADLDPGLKEYFGSFDLIVSYLFDPDGIFEENVKHCAPGQFVTVSPRIEPNEHAALQLARPLAQLGLPAPDLAPHIFPSAQDRVAASAVVRRGEGAVALHPGSGGERKNWSLENWVALGERLLCSGIARKLLVFGGEADGAQLRLLHETWGAQPVSYAENLPLPLVAAAIKNCSAFVGHDSGISHLAAAVGTPSILLFGPTDPKIWAPKNENLHVVRSSSQSINDISVQQVFETVRQLSYEQSLST